MNSLHLVRKDFCFGQMKLEEIPRKAQIQVKEIKCYKKLKLIIDLE